MEGQRTLVDSAKGKLLRTLEKEVAFFRIEKGETAQVDFLLVHLGLPKIRVVSEGRSHTGSDAIKEIEPRIELVIVDRVHRTPLGRNIRLELNPLAGRHSKQAVYAACFLQGEPSAIASSPHPACAFLIAGKPTAEINAPFIGSRIEGDASKRYGEFRRPTKLVPLRPDLPNGVPIHLRATHVGIDQSLALGSVCVGPEIIALPTPLKRIQ